MFLLNAKTNPTRNNNKIYVESIICVVILPIVDARMIRKGIVVMTRGFVSRGVITFVEDCAYELILPS